MNKKGGEKKMEKTQEMIYVFKETCEKCEKEFRSHHEGALKHNFAVHQLSCKGKK